MPFRFIHTADIHLDSPLKSLAMRNPRLADLISNASRRVLESIIDLCLEETVDALLIAGDLYDGSQTSMKTARFLAQQLRRLDDAGIQVFIIRGNHDAMSRITRELVFPDNVHVFSGRAEAICLQSSSGELPVFVHGVSFSQPQAPESLLPKYKVPVADAINIGLMHTSLDGSPQHDPYAPCKLVDLQSSGFDYWGLGHIHKRMAFDGEAGGTAAVVMPGIPQGRDIGEAGLKSVTLVCVDDERQVDITEYPTALAQFEVFVFSVTDHVDRSLMIEQLVSDVLAFRSTCTADNLVVRIDLQGHSPLAWLLRRDADLLQADIEARLGEDGDIWIDKILHNCSAVTAETAELDSNPIHELAELVNAEITNSSHFEEDALAVVKLLQSALPAELRDELGHDEESLRLIGRELAEEGAKRIIAHLQPVADADK